MAGTKAACAEGDMVSYADSYELVQAESAPAERYEEDVLLANLNPALAALATFHTSDDVRDSAPALIEADLDGFLDRVYALASHI